MKYLVAAFSIVFSLLLLSGCDRPPVLNGFNGNTWKADRNGCQGTRLKDLPALLNQKHKLPGCSERDLVNLLGAPDAQELRSRNQKFYDYYIAGAPACKGAAGAIRILRVRISATNHVTEVTVETDGNPERVTEPSEAERPEPS